jgi:uncharacterized protein YndB with AHSA1/START domain
MIQPPNPDLDLTLARVIKAPRPVVWNAWTDRASFEQWWVPAPARCKVMAMELRPGGALETLISEDGGEYVPHLSACFLDIIDGEQIVFTNALLGGWRPAENAFMTAIITLREHPEGTEYVCHVMHKNNADRTMHETMGFYDGWGTVADQLATLAERGSAIAAATAS